MMFLFTVIPRNGAIAMAAMAFLLGLVAGAIMSPVSSGRSLVLDEKPQVAPVQLANPTQAAYPAEVLRVNDGDTFEARVQVWPGLAVTTKVRLRGIDTPELKARCGEEQSKAEAARAALRKILDEGGVTVTRVSLDKYGGRVLAEAATRLTSDISRQMLANGHARPYSGGTRQGWCGHASRS
jgi:endonuclease YncB( thermonuclease family)